MAPAHGAAEPGSGLGLQLVIEEIGIGAAVGLGVAGVGAWLLKRCANTVWVSKVWVQISVPALAIACFTIAQSAHGSGYRAQPHDRSRGARLPRVGRNRRKQLHKLFLGWFGPRGLPDFTRNHGGDGEGGRSVPRSPELRNPVVSSYQGVPPPRGLTRAIGCRVLVGRNASLVFMS